MEEETEFKKLPVDEQCVHKLWKARLNGYEETIKIFRQIDDDKSPEWSRFVFLLKKFVADAHAMAQERGLEATLICVERCAAATKVAAEVLNAVVQKCIAAQKQRSRELAAQVVMMYVEVERHEIVVDELIKGMEHKNPKIVAACVQTVTEALREFGHKVIAVKPLVKQIGRLLSDRDKTVREQGKAMTVEMYRWIGDALKPQLATLPAVVLGELEAEFAKMGGDKAEPKRYLRSQQARVAAMPTNGAGDGDGADGDDGDDGADGAEEIDPLDLIDPVDILSKLPKDFYDKLEDKKWQTRKEALEALDEQLKNPKLMPGDYGELVKALKKVLAKDTNVVLVAMAGKQLAALARGLGKKFTPYAPFCVSAILEKFKEKKAAVVTALRDAMDAIYPSTTLEAMQEDVFEALANKNPSVKAETAGFLARAIVRTQPVVFNKKLLKALTVALLKTLNESDPGVRDGSAEALGTLHKLLGEKTMAPYVTDVDPLKMAKVKECADKAEILVKMPKKTSPAAKPAAAAAPPKAAPAKEAAKPVKRPATSTATLRKTGTGAGAAGKKPAAGAGASAAAAPAAAKASALPGERELTPEEVVERAAELLHANCLAELSDANWKQRLSAAETVLSTVAGMTDVRPLEHSQVLCKLLCLQKPGLKDTNFQVVKVKLEAVRTIVETMGISTVTADCIANDVTEKLSDAKNAALAAGVLSAMAESLNLQYVVGKVLVFAFEQKSPKVQSESLIWVGRSVQEFGMQVNVKMLIDDVRKAVTSTNPTVRQAAISVLGTLHLYAGDSLMMFFDGEKPAVKQQIQAEFDKNAGQKAPAPIRGPAMKAAKSSENGAAEGEADEDADDDDAAPAVNLKDLLPRVDISGQITEAFLAEICDKNWKTRNEGLVKLQGILNEAKMIHPNIGDLPHALGQRLVDSNAKIAQTALAICQQLAESMGPPCKQYVRAFFPGFLNGLGDGKAFIRQASITCMNVWGDQCGYKEFFDGEMIAEALRNGSPALRAELWAWLAERLAALPARSVSKDELVPCLPTLYLNIGDRNADVRKHSNDAVYAFMLHLGYEGMVKALEKVKPSSKKDVAAALDKTRPNLPVKPLPKGKLQAPILDDGPAMSARSAKAAPAATVSKIQKAGSGAKLNQAAAAAGGAAAAAATKAKDEDVDTSPMLMVNNLKNQRMLDEQKLKVLKWNFTTPREEFIELLRDQMTAASVNKALMANMFHADFRYHLKAIDTLLEDLPGNSRALICNLDLVLKWISLRFYDTNPSVLLKGLEYLTLVFEMLNEQNYSLAEAEGSCFIPHLLIKIGDPKDAVRNSVRAIIRKICEVYPFTKVFAYTMDGLKSKNARQRTECLDELGTLIEQYGINVCVPSPGAAMKEVARHIGDRDNSVRSAALNCIVQAQFLIGDRVLKMIGNLSDKDMSMLEERIKRAMKAKRAEMGPSEENVGATAAVSPPHNVSVRSVHNTSGSGSASGSPEAAEYESDSGAGGDSAESLPEQRYGSSDGGPYTPVGPEAPVPLTANVVKAPTLTGPFGLDPNVIAEIEKDWVRVDELPPEPELPEVDISFLYSPLKTHKVNGVAYPMERLQMLIDRSRAAGGPRLAGAGAAGGAAPNPVAELPKQLDPKLTRTIEMLGSSCSLISRSAFNEIYKIIDDSEKQLALRDYEDLYIASICQQFRHLSQLPTSEALNMYQPVLSSIYTFFSASALGQNLSIDSLKLVMTALLGLLADNKLAGEDGQYTKVLNGVCLRILERSNFSKLNCALIRLLKETCTNGGMPKFTDLLMKCMWRNVKMMPDKAASMDMNIILRELDEFMLMLPTIWWATRPVDTPLRTVKTIIHNVVKLRGNDIIQDLTGISPQNELYGYLLKVLKNHKRIELANAAAAAASTAAATAAPAASATATAPVTGITNDTHEAMSSIFKQIANKNEAQAGLARLYEYKKSHPDIDLSQFLMGAKPVFQKFIEDGLAELESKETANAGKTTAADGPKKPTANSKQVIDPDYWMDRLKTLMNPNYENDNDENKAQSSNNRMDAGASGIDKQKLERPQLASNRIDHLQQKLSQYRQSN